MTSAVAAIPSFVFQDENGKQFKVPVPKELCDSASLDQITKLGKGLADKMSRNGEGGKAWLALKAAGLDDPKKPEYIKTEEGWKKFVKIMSPYLNEKEEWFEEPERKQRMIAGRLQWICREVARGRSIKMKRQGKSDSEINTAVGSAYLEYFNNYIKARVAAEAHKPNPLKCSYPACEFDAVRVKVQLCSQCKIAQYCTPGCQKSHWKAHKLDCKKPEGKVKS